MLREHFENPVGDDAMPQVVGVDSVVMHHPGGVPVGGEYVDEQAIFQDRYFLNSRIVTLEKWQVGVIPVRAVHFEARHEVGTHQDDQGLDVLTYFPDETGEFLLEQLERRSSAGVI